MKKTLSVALTTLTLALAGAAQAAVVYDNGAPNQQNGNEMTQWIQAEDFTLVNTTTVTDVHFWAVQDPATANGIYYAFYSDSGGAPSLNPLNPFALGANLVTTCGAVLFFGTECEHSFDVVPFVALGGTTYWLALHNGPLTNDQRQEFYWETTNPNATTLGQEDVLPPDGDGWSSNSQEHSFQLTGEGGNVPEPVSLALLGIGLAGIGFSRRRRP